MTLLTRIENVKRVWAILLPHVNPPSEMWIAKWCATFSDDVIENGIARSAFKFPHAVDNSERVHRYTSSTLRNSVQKAAEVALK